MIKTLYKSEKVTERLGKNTVCVCVRECVIERGSLKKQPGKAVRQAGVRAKVNDSLTGDLAAAFDQVSPVRQK